MTRVTRDDYSRNVYTVRIGGCNVLTSVDESKYEEKRQNLLICPGEYISKNEPNKISEKTVRLYFVPGSHTLLYQQSNQNSFILSSLSSALHYMGDKLASEYIIRLKQNSLLEVHNKGQMHFCRDILMGHNREKKINYRI